MNEIKGAKLKKQVYHFLQGRLKFPEHPHNLIKFLHGLYITPLGLPVVPDV